MFRMVGLAAAIVALGSGQAAAQVAAERRLDLFFDQSGAVTLAAQNVAVRDILAEWARQCGCFIVNADKLSGVPSPVPLQFDQRPQAEVLASLLRQAAGYTLTPKRDNATGPSDYETIYILASTSAAPVGAGAPVDTPVAMPILSPGSPDDEIPPITPPAPVDPRQPINAEPAAENANPEPPPPPAVPGVNVPAVRIVPVGR